MFCVSAYAFGDIIKEKICFKHTCIEAEIADSEEKRVKGLMFREDLTESQGMLFVLEPGQKPKFWMKNVKFSLDIIWINEDKRVVDIKTNIPPCRDYCESIGSKQEARYILEVRGGFVNKYQIKIGDEVGFKH